MAVYVSYMRIAGNLPCSLQSRLGTRSMAARVLALGYLRNVRALELRIPNCAKAANRFWNRRLQFLGMTATLKGMTERVWQLEFASVWPDPAGGSTAIHSTSPQAVLETSPAERESTPQEALLATLAHQSQSNLGVRVTPPVITSVNIPFNVYSQADLARLGVASIEEFQSLQKPERDYALRRFMQYTDRERAAVLMVLEALGIEVDSAYGIPTRTPNAAECERIAQLAGIVRYGSGLFEKFRRLHSERARDLNDRRSATANASSIPAPVPWLRPLSAAQLALALATEELRPIQARSAALDAPADSVDHFAARRVPSFYPKRRRIGDPDQSIRTWRDLYGQQLTTEAATLPFATAQRPTTFADITGGLPHRQAIEPRDTLRELLASLTPAAGPTPTVEQRDGEDPVVASSFDLGLPALGDEILEIALRTVPSDQAAEPPVSNTDDACGATSTNVIPHNLSIADSEEFTQQPLTMNDLHMDASPALSSSQGPDQTSTQLPGEAAGTQTVTPPSISAEMIGKAVRTVVRRAINKSGTAFADTGALEIQVGYIVGGVCTIVDDVPDEHVVLYLRKHYFEFEDELGGCEVMLSKSMLRFQRI